MEAGESGRSRQSNHEQSEPQPRNPFDRPLYRDGPNMATATLMNPTDPYHPHHHHHHRPSFPPPAFPSSSSAPTSAISGMISPAESRRTSDETDPPQRQLLPSISEVISGAKPSYSASLPASVPPTPSLPSPFSASAPSRPYSEASSDRLSSSRSLHPPTSSLHHRSDILPASSDAGRHVASGRPPPLGPPPPPSAYSRQQPSPPMRLERPEAERRQEVDAHRSREAYSHQPSPQSASSLYSQPGQLPPGQLPLSAGYHPVSPRHGGPSSLPSPYDSHRPHMYGEEDSGDRGAKYEGVLDRAFEAWNYTEALSRIAGASRTVFNFAEAFDTAAREPQHHGQSIPSRLPTENELSIMSDNVYMMRKCLEDVRGMVRQNNIVNERGREGSGPRKDYDDEEISMYSESSKSGYGLLPDVKKRRGRAAPPGRCHSCNRIDTPEWRRGPDGARTLCNACGLHYAKLERKRVLEQRSIRSKTVDER